MTVIWLGKHLLAIQFRCHIKQDIAQPAIPQALLFAVVPAYVQLIRRALRSHLCIDDPFSFVALSADLEKNLPFSPLKVGLLPRPSPNCLCHALHLHKIGAQSQSMSCFTSLWCIYYINGCAFEQAGASICPVILAARSRLSG